MYRYEMSISPPVSGRSLAFDLETSRQGIISTFLRDHRQRQEVSRRRLMPSASLQSPLDLLARALESGNLIGLEIEAIQWILADPSPVVENYLVVAELGWLKLPAWTKMMLLNAIGRKLPLPILRTAPCLQIGDESTRSFPLTISRCEEFNG